ncbi:MAG: 50S ribosomal protein L10, partial [Ruminococcaceae bacterium]|nr:50S ribosomal protein L10 [Oscillospiraceae bacterium]
MLRFAANQIGFDALDEHLNGTTALAISPSDPVAAAKVLSEFAKKSNGSFTIKAGFVDGKVINADEVKALADLPSREVLVAQVLGGLNAPISGFVNVLNGNLRGLVVALNAIAEQKGGEAAE